VAIQNVKHIESCNSGVIHLTQKMDVTHDSEVNKRTLESLLCNLNSLVEKHLREWLTLPQSERMEAVLQELKKL
jgi:hypothetical protein